MGRGKKLATDTILFGISSFGSKILTLLLTPLYTAILSAEQYGVADLISTTINFIYPILTLAISDATLRFSFEKEKSKKGVLNTSMAFILASTVFLVILYPAIKAISTQLASYWTIFVVTYFLFNVQSCFSNFIKGLGYTRLFAAQGVIHTLAIVCSNIVFLILLEWGLNGYLYSIIVGYMISILMMFFSARLYRYLLPLEVDKALVRDMLKYSIPMIPTILAWSVNAYIDKYMIIYFCGLADSGIYSVAHKIPSVVTAITTIFTNAWQLSVIDSFGEKGSDEFFTRVYKAFNLLMVCLVVVFIPFSKIISTILFAEEYYPAWSAAPFLLISTMFSSLAGFLAAAFRAAKKTKNLMTSVLIGAVINIALNYILIQALGFIGAAVATAVSFLFVWLTRFIHAQRIVKISISVIPTIVTYFLVFVMSLWYCTEGRFFWWYYVIAVAVIMIVNFKDTKGLLLLLKPMITKIFHRHKPS